MAPPPLFVSILLWCTLLAAAYGQRAPIHIPTDGARWLGNDGNWSTATIRIGTPAQYAYVLISTTISETWVAGSAWCSDSASGYSCEERGNAVDTAASSTWEEFGQYSLGYRPELTDQRDQYSVKDMGYGDYGLDVLKFKTTGSNPGEYSFDRQIIGVINDTTHLVGMMGLNVASRSFINETTYPSLMSTLYDNGTIPSRSYGYTAGAYHRTPQVPMDLVLGGTNYGRYLPHEATFELDSNENLVLTLESLAVSATGIPPWGPGPETLSINPIQVQIDSTTPYLWLPVETCRKFESALGLVWDSDSELYLMNNTVIQSLTALNLTFTFSLVDKPGGANTTTIQLPYAALNLNIGFPFINSSSNVPYFPLKRATAQNQYTLGRSFLTEAYIAVDYERGNFSVYQTLYPIGADNIVDTNHPPNGTGIIVTTTTITNNTSSKTGLPTGAVIGIAVGAAAAVLVVCLVGFCLYSRRRKIRKEEEAAMGGAGTAAWEGEPKPPGYTEDGSFVPELPQDEVVRYELASVNFDPAELGGQSHLAEIDETRAM